MKKGRHYSKEEIAVISQTAIVKSFREISDAELISFGEDKTQKGTLGGIIEENLFGIEQNNESEPDFIDAGIELKVTPYKRNKDNSLSAKERLVLNMIDFNTEYKNQFLTSHFWFKNNKLQILWYLHEEGKNRLDFKITHEKLLNLSISEDLKQIEEDWNYIINKIRNGKANELSEADTMYLGACTKGANSKDTTTQPFSDIKAMRRAFCFKQSYMTQLVRKYIGSYEEVEKILKNTSKTFKYYVNDVISKYIGKTQAELKKILDIDSSAKNINGIIVNKMFGIKGRLSDTDEFIKANIIPRTIRIEQNGKIKESFPFTSFKYTELIKEEWETSELRNLLETTKYMFFIFENNGNDYVFKGIKLWNISELDIETYVKPMWLKTQEVVLNGNIVKTIDEYGNRTTNFPGMANNPICHVRPRARDASDTYPLPVADKLTGLTKYTKHCFWLNNKYIEEILNKVS